MDIQEIQIADNGVFPGNELPALYCRKGLDIPLLFPATHVKAVFEQNGWRNSWDYGIFTFHHYHSITHEVLGAYSGKARIQLGGDQGAVITLKKGDVLIIPAGVAHKNLDAENAVSVVGAYPDGLPYDMNYGKSSERPKVDKNIAKVPLPMQDPIGSETLAQYWHIQHLVPRQHAGRATDFSEEKKYPTKAGARAAFKTAADRLLNINQWQKYAGLGSAIFSLHNNQGEAANGYAAEGALISIGLPVPGSDAGDGSEWVMIERMDAHSDAKAEEEFVAMTVRPIPEPHHTSPEIAHFYKDISTSTFIVKRAGTTVSAAVHGRNETPNNENANLHDKVRNTLIALGARAGLAGPQWKKLVKGLLQTQVS